MLLVVEPRWGSRAIGIPVPVCAARPRAVLLDRFAVMEHGVYCFSTSTTICVVEKTNGELENTLRDIVG